MLCARSPLSHMMRSSGVCVVNLEVARAKMTGGSGYRWSDEGNFAELTRVGDEWALAYGFEATAQSGQRVVARRTTPEYADAVRQLWQIIGYYFAAPEHAERVRRELLERAGLDPGASKYLPVPDPTYLTAAGGGAGAAAEVAAEVARRARILNGESEPPSPPVAATPDEKRPWWKRIRR